MKIICIGRNYPAHIQEFNNEISQNPIFFLKPETSMIVHNRPFFLPDFSENMQYEVELIVRICKLGKCIQKKFAHTYYDEIGLGVDFTARDLQENAKKNGLPWEICKAFDGSAIMSEFIPKTQFNDIQNINFSLLLNGKTVQKGNSAEMIFSIDEIIAYVSQFITLKIGDVIYTGTPVGVGKIAINDQLQGYIENQKMFDFRIK